MKIKINLKLDPAYLNFEKQCFLINNILIKQNYFLIIKDVSPKKKIRHVINENSNKKL